MNPYRLTRIIGNDLPPRHSDDQSLTNIEYILENEPHLAGCDKHFFVNRILCPNKEATIIALLRKHDASFTVRTVDEEVYRQIGTKEDKIGYLISLNTARNTQIETDIAAGYECSLTLDGNCFFTQSAWDSFKMVADHNPTAGYYIIPMARCLDYDEIGKPPRILENWRGNGRIITSATEPQVAFTQHHDIKYLTRFPYGKASKAHILWRLGVAGIWDKWYPTERRNCLRSVSEFFEKCPHAGFVYRLPSSVASAESDNAIRGELRDQGMTRLMAEADTLLL